MLWITALTTPLLVALLLGSGRASRRGYGALLALAALPALVLGWTGGGSETHHIHTFLLGSEFNLDALRATLLSFTAFLWGVAGWASGPYLAENERKGPYAFFFSLSMTGNFGLVMAADVVTFYAFFVLMTFASYGLIIHTATTAAHRAARIYLIMAIIGEILLLAALLLAVNEAGTPALSEIRKAVATSSSRGVIVMLAIAGFGVKAGAVPLYFWLPLAHPVAPTPASAVLSGAMIKAGILGWVHLLPFGEAGLPVGGGWVIGAGVFAALWAAVIGAAQTQPKTILAYSSVSQMGVMTALLGIALADESLWTTAAPALAFYAAMHGLAKGALFLGTAVIPVAQTARLLRLAILALTALVIAGAPPLAGYAAKYAVKDLAAHAPGYWPTLLPILITVSGFTTAFLLTRFLWAVASEPLPDSNPAPNASAMAFPWALASLGALFGPFLLNPRHGAAVAFPATSIPSLTTSIVPIILAITAIALVMRFVAAKPRKPLVPPGDLIVLIEYGLSQFQRAFRFGGRVNPQYELLNIVNLFDRVIAFETTKSWVDRVEASLETWKWVGFFFILFSLGFLGLLLL